MKKLLILLLLPITIFSQENHYDTTIARLINEKINEYRISKGLNNLIQTDRFKSETEQYCVKAAQKLTETRIIEHSSLVPPGGWSEIICSVAFNGAELSADSLAKRVITAYINSRPHHAALLSIGVTKIHTSVYIYYNPKQKMWKLFTASHILDWEYEVDLQYSSIKLEF